MQYDFPNSQGVDRIGRGAAVAWQRRSSLGRVPPSGGDGAIPHFRYLQKQDYFAGSPNESFRAFCEYINYEKKYFLR